MSVTLTEEAYKELRESQERSIKKLADIVKQMDDYHRAFSEAFGWAVYWRHRVENADPADMEAFDEFCKKHGYDPKEGEE